MMTANASRLSARTLATTAAAVADVTATRRGTDLRDTRGVSERLVESAFALFSTRDFDDVTVNEIAAGANVGTRTFFRYFPTKETVILDVYDHMNKRLTELIATAPTGLDPVAVVENAIADWFDEHQALTAEVSRLMESSDALRKAILLRAGVWEQHVGEALVSRAPSEDEKDMAVLAAVAYALLRVAGSIILAGESPREAAHTTFARMRRLATLPATQDIVG